jgi:hypothetical protein
MADPAWQCDGLSIWLDAQRLALNETADERG